MSNDVQNFELEERYFQDQEISIFEMLSSSAAVGTQPQNAVGSKAGHDGLAELKSSGRQLPALAGIVALYFNTAI